MPEARGVLELVHRSMGAFTPSERKVARALLAAYPIAGLESITQLAGRAGVSPPTVGRFAAKLGFDGVVDLHRALRSEVQARLGSPIAHYARRPAGAAPDAVVDAARRTFRRGLEGTYESLAAGALQDVARLLADRRLRVLCLGGRFSHSLAYYLFAHLHTMRPGAVLLEPAPLPFRDALVDAGRRDVLCVFDYRRYQRDTVEAARAASARGCRLVLFTDPETSPIAEFADHVLCSNVDAPSPFDSLVSGMALVETVVAAVFLALGDPGVRRRIEELELLHPGFTVDR